MRQYKCTHLYFKLSRAKQSLENYHLNVRNILIPKAHQLSHDTQISTNKQKSKYFIGMYSRYSLYTLNIPIHLYKLKYLAELLRPKIVLFVKKKRSNIFNDLTGL